MSHFRRGVVAALVLWAVGMSVAAAVRQAHPDETPARVGPTAGPRPVAGAPGQAGAR
jgi:hypothetical protein